MKGLKNNNVVCGLGIPEKINIYFEFTVWIISCQVLYVHRQNIQ